MMKVSRDLSFQFPAHDDFNLTHYLTSSLTSDSNQPLDPFQKLYHLLLDSNSNEPSESVYAITIGFGLLFGLIILICLSLLAHPFFKKHPSRHLWLVRKCHTAYSTPRMPYVVLNGGLSLAICQLMGCIVFELFIIISFLSHRYPDRDYGPYEAFCQITMWLPGFYGFLASAFSALYVCISAAGEELRFFLLKPTNYNALLIIIPSYVTLQALAWAITACLAVSQQLKEFNALLQLLILHSHDWQSSHELQDVSDLSKAFDRIRHFTVIRLQIRRGACLSWLPIAFGLLWFYVYTIISLLRLIRKSVHVTSSSIQSVDNKPFPISVLPHLSISPGETLLEIQRSYRFLLWHCVFMSFCIIWNAGVGVVMLCSVPKIVNDSNWFLFNECICLGGGGFLSIGMIFQSWRIMTEGGRTTDDTVATFNPTLLK